MLGELLMTFTGLLSFGIILFVIGMAVFFTRMFIKKSMEEPSK